MDGKPEKPSKAISEAIAPSKLLRKAPGEAALANRKIQKTSNMVY